MREPERVFTAVVLAADRTSADPVARRAGVSCKAFAPVAGVPMILRVIRALESSSRVRRIVLAGPPERLLAELPELHDLIRAGTVDWRANRDSPSQSAVEAFATVAPAEPLLLTTADHALLRGDVVDHFLAGSRASGAQATAALVSHRSVLAMFPGSRRTALRMRGGAVCSCNLFAFLSPGARELVAFWRRVERERKHPLRMVAGLLGITGVAAYAAGALTLSVALRRLSQRLGIDVQAVMLPFPEAGVDVDTPADLALAEALLACAPVAGPSGAAPA